MPFVFLGLVLGAAPLAEYYKTCAPDAPFGSLPLLLPVLEPPLGTPELGPAAVIQILIRLNLCSQRTHAITPTARTSPRNSQSLCNANITKTSICALDDPRHLPFLAISIAAAMQILIRHPSALPTMLDACLFLQSPYFPLRQILIQGTLIKLAASTYCIHQRIKFDLVVERSRLGIQKLVLDKSKLGEFKFTRGRFAFYKTVP